MARHVTRRFRSEAEYEQALEEIERFFDNEPKPGTAESARFDELARVIDEYENERWHVDAREAARRKAGKPK